jgi:hypothetical protein
MGSHPNVASMSRASQSAYGFSSADGFPHPIELGDFHADQAKELARIHRLRWTRREIDETLMPHVGGQPYLLRLAMYDARRRIRSLDDVARDARDGDATKGMMLECSGGP